MLHERISHLVIPLVVGVLVSRGALARPIRQLQQSGTELNAYIISSGDLSQRWTDWSWSMRKMPRTDSTNHLFCIQLDPYGALSLKSEEVFTAEDNTLNLSLQKFEKGSPALNDIRIQLEGCVLDSAGYSITASRTLEEAVRTNYAAEDSERLLQEINEGERVELSLPLMQFNEKDSEGCSYNRITIGRCIKALTENTACEILGGELRQEFRLCVDSMSLENAR